MFKWRRTNLNWYFNQRVPIVHSQGRSAGWNRLYLSRVHDSISLQWNVPWRGSPGVTVDQDNTEKRKSLCYYCRGKRLVFTATCHFCPFFITTFPQLSKTTQELWETKLSSSTLALRQFTTPPAKHMLTYLLRLKTEHSIMILASLKIRNYFRI